MRKTCLFLFNFGQVKRKDAQTESEDLSLGHNQTSLKHSDISNDVFVLYGPDITHYLPLHVARISYGTPLAALRPAGKGSRASSKEATRSHRPKNAMLH
jgi:hypothetical protein